MANHLDFLAALDRHTRTSPLGKVLTAYELHVLAADAGLVAAGETTAAYWTGELVDDGYVRVRAHDPRRHPVPLGVGWTDRELQWFSDFSVTPAGREEADRMHRLAREAATDAALGARLPLLAHAWPSPAQADAIAGPLSELRSALDRGHNVTAIGAAKNLVEAACKIVLEHRGEPVPPKSTSLSVLFKLALTAAKPVGADADGAVGRSLTATVHRLGELRNAVGAGHGQSAAAEVGTSHARLAATAAAGIAEFLLSALDE